MRIYDRECLLGESDYTWIEIVSDELDLDRDILMDINEPYKIVYNKIISVLEIFEGWS